MRVYGLCCAINESTYYPLRLHDFGRCDASDRSNKAFVSPLTDLRQPQVSGDALPAVQLSSVRSHLELVLVASVQGPGLGLEPGQGDPPGHPVGAAGQQGAVQHLHAVQVVRLGGQRLELQGR